MIEISIYVLTLVVVLIVAEKLRKAGRPSKMFSRYNHHGNMVWGRNDLRGRHRDHCLCFDCKRFHPGSKGNCLVAQTLYKLCRDYRLVTPVWECPKFLQDPFADPRKWNQGDSCVH